LIKFKFCQICLNLFKRVRPNLLFITNSLFIRPIIRQIQPIFVFSKNSYSFRSSNTFRSNFSKFCKIRRIRLPCEFFLPVEFLNTGSDCLKISLLQFVVFGLVFYSREGRVIVSLSARRSVLPCPFLHGISFRFVYSAEQAEPGQFSVATLDLKSRSLGESFFLCRSFSWPASDLARARKDHQLHQGFSRLLRSSFCVGFLPAHAQALLVSAPAVFWVWSTVVHMPSPQLILLPGFQSSWPLPTVLRFSRWWLPFC
jgi:hypothetical protein